MSRLFSVQPKYLQEVNLAWKQKTTGREQDLARQIGRSLPIVINNLFLKGQPVNRLNFIEICELLELDWREIAGLDLQERLVSSVEEALDNLVSTHCEMLRRLTRKARDLLGADRASIFLLDSERQQLGSVIADDGSGGSLVIEIPSHKGIAGLAATRLKVINIPFDVYDDVRSEEAKNIDKKTGYRTYTVLAWPLLNKQKNLVAVVQLINKLKSNYNPEDELLSRIDPKGFTQSDEAVLAKFVPSILRTLERCQSCYLLIQKLQENAEYYQADNIQEARKLIARLKQQEQQLRKRLDKI